MEDVFVPRRVAGFREDAAEISESGLKPASFMLASTPSWFCMEVPAHTFFVNGPSGTSSRRGIQAGASRRGYDRDA